MHKLGVFCLFYYVLSAGGSTFYVHLG